jgi:hypothetical protein
LDILTENIALINLKDLFILYRCTAKGFRPDEVDKCIEDYEALDVWQLNQAKTKLTFVQV